MIPPIVLFFILYFFSPTSAENIQVTIVDGVIEGVQEISHAGTLYNSFYSIPYAKPPTGKLRFQPPVPVDPWSGVYNATIFKNICYQVGTNPGSENEDCLSLTVFTPLDLSKQVNESLPVMFEIHGGGFVMGSGFVRPGYFMDNNVVLVSTNYRLGPFGFMSTGDTIIPGNAGLKDQVLALKWTRTNIAVFGGDPDRITILGQSAGGASVGYHILSPQSSGLFSAAILESGTALCPWAYQRNQTEITYQTASFINSEFYKERDSQKLLDFLQSVDATTIDDASERYTNWASSNSETGNFGIATSQLEQGFYYAPVIEVEHDTAFLTQRQYEAYYNGEINTVPTFIGGCSEEGLTNYNDNLENVLSVYDTNPQYLVPQGMHIVDNKTLDNVGNLIKQNYSPDSPMKDNLLSGIQYYTDQDFLKSIIKHAELQANYSDIYFYIFSYSGKMGGNTVHYPGSGNVTHIEEYSYIFENNNPKDFPEQDQIVHQRLVRLWVNFVKYHNPTPTEDSLLQNIIWPKFTLGNLEYVDIGIDLEIKVDPKKAKYNFWYNLFEEYGVKPFDTF